MDSTFDNVFSGESSLCLSSVKVMKQTVFYLLHIHPTEEQKGCRWAVYLLAAPVDLSGDNVTGTSGKRHETEGEGLNKDE